MNTAAQPVETLLETVAAVDPTEPPAICDLDTARIPHISIHVFRETDQFAEVWEQASNDRRLVSATTTIFDGGFDGAVRRYITEKTPDLIIVETDSSEEILEYQADALAEVCDPGTQLIVVGHKNDIHLYQKLLSMGVANYIVYPVTISTIISSISEVYREPGREKIGKVFAFIGAKGGVGSSTIAQNVAFDLAQNRDADVLLVDMDLSFGTSALNLDVEPNQGLIELIDQAERVDVAMLDRVLVKRGVHLNLLGSTASLENPRDLDEFSVERIIDVAQTHIPNIVLDIPHCWSEWAQRALVAADKVAVVATPDIVSLRNASAMINQLKQLRPNDSRPSLILNQTGMPKRQEISAREIASVLKLEPLVSIAFEPKLFSAASSRGKMIAEIAKKRPAAKACHAIAEALSPTAPPQSSRAKTSLFRQR